MNAKRRIFHLQFKKFFTLKPSQIILFLLLIFSIGCQDHPCSKDEETIFLENLMIRFGGLYVLMGSKPMIDFPIEKGYPETEEECKIDYVQYLNQCKEENRDSAPMDYESYQSMCLNAPHNHYKKLWKMCAQKINDCAGPCYRLIEIKEMGVFINILNTLIVLNQHYDEFARVNGAPFDPEKVIGEIEEASSSFWNKIFDSSYTIGLLLGYGKRNAFIFNWEQKNRVFLTRFVDLNRRLSTQRKKNVSAEDLSLPCFCTFSLGDETMEGYKRERAQIVKELQGKDFGKTVKEWLKRGIQDKHEIRELTE